MLNNTFHYVPSTSKLIAADSTPPDPTNTRESIEMSENKKKSSRIRTQSFNKDEKQEPTNTTTTTTTTNTTDLKASFLRLLSSGSNKLSQSPHIDHIAPKRSGSIKINKDIEKEELLSKFKKNRSISHSYNNYDEMSDESESGDELRPINDGQQMSPGNKLSTYFGQSYEDPSPAIAAKAMLLIQNEHHHHHHHNNKLSRVNSVKLSTTTNSDSTSSISNNSGDNNTPPNSLSHLIIAKDENNNQEKQSVNSMIVMDTKNNSAVQPVKIVHVHKQRRTDSIRMRHPSNANLASYGGKSSVKEEGDIGGESKRTRLFRRLWRKKKSATHVSQRHNYFVIFILFVVNLLNYIDRFTLAGIIFF